MYDQELDTVQNPRKHIRPGSNSFKAIRHAKLLPSPVRRERPAYSCYEEIRSRELLPSPARRERPAYSCYAEIRSRELLPSPARPAYSCYAEIRGRELLPSPARPAYSCYAEIRGRELLPSPARPAYSCYAEIRGRELLPSPARRERLVCSSYDITSNKGLPQRLRKRMKQDVSETKKVMCSKRVLSLQTNLNSTSQCFQSKISKFHSEMASLQMSMCITYCERFPGLTVRFCACAAKRSLAEKNEKSYCFVSSVVQ